MNKIINELLKKDYDELDYKKNNCITWRVTTPLYQILEAESKKLSMSKSEFLTHLFKTYLKNNQIL